jgi:hypothetical protein
LFRAFTFFFVLSSFLRVPLFWYAESTHHSFRWWNFTSSRGIFVFQCTLSFPLFQGKLMLCRLANINNQSISALFFGILLWYIFSPFLWNWTVFLVSKATYFPWHPIFSMAPKLQNVPWPIFSFQCSFTCKAEVLRACVLIFSLIEAAFSSSFFIYYKLPFLLWLEAPTLTLEWCALFSLKADKTWDFLVTMFTVANCYRLIVFLGHFFIVHLFLGMF